MESRVKRALENHGKGYNCSQSVACAYCDLVGIEEETIFRMMEGYGLGMGGAQATCGAVSGAVAIAGLKNSSGNTKKPVTKGQTYQLSREIVNEFAKKNQSIVCKELKGMESGKMLRSCDGCIEDAAVLIEKILFSEQRQGS